MEHYLLIKKDFWDSELITTMMPSDIVDYIYLASLCDREGRISVKKIQELPARTQNEANIKIAILKLKGLGFNDEKSFVLKDYNLYFSISKRAPASMEKETDDIRRVFLFWVNTFKKAAHTRLDNKRKYFIGKAIKEYGVDICEQAILGCAKSPWHNGENPNNTKYNDIELILRNSKQIEKFAEQANAKSRIENFIDF